MNLQNINQYSNILAKLTNSKKTNVITEQNLETNVIKNPVLQIITSPKSPKKTGSKKNSETNNSISIENNNEALASASEINVENKVKLTAKKRTNTKKNTNENNLDNHELSNDNPLMIIDNENTISNIKEPSKPNLKKDKQTLSQEVSNGNDVEHKDDIQKPIKTKNNKINGFEYLSERKIVELCGWEKSWIPKLLGEPDKIQKPKEKFINGKATVNMKLYSAERILAIMEMPEFLELKETAQNHITNHSENQLITEENTNSNRNWTHIINNLKIQVLSYGNEKNVDSIPLRHTLLNDAIYEYNNSIHNQIYLSAQSNKEQLQKAIVLYIKNNMVRYDHMLLEDMFNSDKANEYATLLNTRIFNAIAKQYPEYQSICKKMIR